MLRRLAKKVMAKVTGARPSPPPPPSDPPAAPAAAESLATIEEDAQEVKERIDAGEPVVLLDVRNPAETAQGVIDGAVLIPLPSLSERWEELKDANEIVCYCAAGARSLQAARFLREKGLFNATSMSGGVAAWAGAGGALVPPSGR
jgi:rhodanese-related sulfurtransferase